MRNVQAMMAAVLLLIALAGEATAAGPSLAVSPAAGPPETVFTVTGGGFTPASTARVIVFYLAATAAGGRGERDVLDRRVPVAADGSFTLAVDAAAFVPEVYHVISPDAPSTVVANFTVTGGAGALPGLPNTGGGGAQPHALPIHGLSAVGGMLAVLGIGLLNDGRQRRPVR